jgi:hypothetical protein
MMLRVDAYKGFLNDYARLPSAVRQRCNTFLELVSFDPDDPGFLAACYQDRPGFSFRRRFAYDLAHGYVIYWKVQRRQVGLRDFISLRPVEPVDVDILGIAGPART